MNSIVVTGGVGFIGSNLCKNLLASSKNVIVIDNFNEFYDSKIKRKNFKELKEIALNYSAKLNIFEGDIRDIDFLKNIFKTHKIDTIIHLAAYAGVRPSIENAPLYADVNITGTVNLLEMAKTFNIKHFIFASSSSVYGNSQNATFSETDVVDFPISPYAATKKAGELICYTYHHLYNINMACLRFFTVYGPGQRPDLAIYKFTKLILEDKEVTLFGDGSSERDYTYVDDIVQGIMNAANYIEVHSGIYEIFNLGNSKTASLMEMVNVIEGILGKKAKLKMMALQSGDVNRTNANINKAKELLGYNPQTDFKEGMEKFIRWYRAKNNI